jgi:hypothetical protein
MRESAVDHYLRGLLLEAMRESPQALGELQWVMYWSDFYPYPFRDQMLEDRVNRLARVVGEPIEVTVPTATPIQSDVTPSRVTPSPSATSSERPVPPATFTPGFTLTPSMMPPAPSLP